METTRRRSSWVAGLAATVLAGALLFVGGGPAPVGGRAAMPEDDVLATEDGLHYGPPAPVPELDGLTTDEREALLDWVRAETARIEGDQG